MQAILPLRKFFLVAGVFACANAKRRVVMAQRQQKEHANEATI